MKVRRELLVLSLFIIMEYNLNIMLYLYLVKHEMDRRVVNAKIVVLKLF